MILIIRVFKGLLVTGKAPEGVYVDCLLAWSNVGFFATIEHLT